MKQGSEAHQPTEQASSPTQRALTLALEKLLTPLAYLLIRERIPFQSLAALAKRVYVRVAREHFNLRGRTQTKSRIAMLTGLTRTDVHQILADDSTSDPLASQFNKCRPTSVLGGWYSDPAFCDDDGNPSPLPVKGHGRSFEHLVRKYGSDVPYRTILEELERAEAVYRDDQGRLLPVQQAYVPASGAAPELIQNLGIAANRLTSTICHNVLREPDSSEPPYFQREVFTRALPPEVLDELRDELHEMLTDFYERARERITPYEDPPHQEGYHRLVGTGFYYFQD